MGCGGGAVDVGVGGDWRGRQVVNRKVFILGFRTDELIGRRLDGC